MQSSGTMLQRRPLRAARPGARASRRPAVSVMNANVLIANTKGGGHAFIGLYLAKDLLAKGHTVTILNDGDEVSGGEAGNIVWGARGSCS